VCDGLEHNIVTGHLPTCSVGSLPFWRVKNTLTFQEFTYRQLCLLSIYCFVAKNVMQERGSESLYLLFGFCDPQPILKVLRLRWATAVSMVQSADLLSLVRFSPSIRYRGTTNSSVFRISYTSTSASFYFFPLMMWS